MNSHTTDTFIDWGRRALSLESQAIINTSQKLSHSFASACQMILNCEGNIVTTGLGKSGHVARKIAATLASTGTSGLFLHPSEALHGDLGMLKKQDCLIAVAFGGETHEVIEVTRFSRRLGVPVIGITGKLNSSLADLCEIVLDGSIDREADPLDLAPTCSSTVSMALGDALAVAVMQAKGISEKEFATLHPGGTLGRKLALVSHYMCRDLPKVSPQADFHEVLEKVTTQNFGITAVVDKDGYLIGCISDGDLRRALLKFHGKTLEKNAQELMSKYPKTIFTHTLIVDVMRIMEDHKISRLFVVDPADKKTPLGLIRLQDLLDAKIV